MSQATMNYQAYKAIRVALEHEHAGRTALMKDGDVVEIYNDNGDAYQIGCEKYGLGNFSLVNIGEKPINLGVHTMHLPRQESE